MWMHINHSLMPVCKPLLFQSSPSPASARGGKNKSCLSKHTPLPNFLWSMALAGRCVLSVPFPELFHNRNLLHITGCSLCVRKTHTHPPRLPLQAKETFNSSSRNCYVQTRADSMSFKSITIWKKTQDFLGSDGSLHKSLTFICECVQTNSNAYNSKIWPQCWRMFRHACSFQLLLFVFYLCCTPNVKLWINCKQPNCLHRLCKWVPSNRRLKIIITKQ